jgi:hypothetical protein
VIFGTDFPSLKQLVFWRVDKDGSFTLFDPAPTMVKAGWYYLRSYTTMYIDLNTDVFPTPRRPEDGIEIISGAVTYIGDVVGSINSYRQPPVTVKIEAKRETLKVS